VPCERADHVLLELPRGPGPCLREYLLGVTDGGQNGVDGPDLGLDQLLEQLVERARDVQDVQGRLGGLLTANRAIASDLDLTTVLRRIIEAAVGLVHAQYGALGVIAPEGIGLEQFIHVGMDESTVESIGHLPEGKGLLGLLIEEPHAIRLEDLARHERSVGFPEGHPPMRAFLGVPVRVRDEVFGNLYLTRNDGETFSEQDEEIVQALAAQAGVSIENARLFADAQRRQDWLAESAGVTSRVLAGDEEALQMIAGSVLSLAEADLATLVLPEDGQLLVAVAEGREAEALGGSRYPREGTLSDLVMDTGTPVRLANAEETAQVGGRTIYLAGRFQVGPVMVLPLLGREDVRGTLVVCRNPGKRPFSQLDMEMATSFASHASTALELAEARRGQQRVLLLEDRARIARDLHDHVIQQLFAAGLMVQATSAHLDAERDVAALSDVVTSLDEAIKQIRVSIFQLQPSSTTGLRSAVLGVVGEVRPALGLDPRLDLAGPLDSLITDDLVREVTAVVREALTNVAKHAHASAVRLSIRATTSQLTVTISDDGRGMTATTRRSGLENLRRRAEGRHGSMVVADLPDLGGTTLIWSVPIG
jgi:signal transduction histidine kinase